MSRQGFSDGRAPLTAAVLANSSIIRGLGVGLDFASIFTPE
jgi:hypothetical protein